MQPYNTEICFIGVGWAFNRFFPHTKLFEDFIWRGIESGLTTVWMKRTVAAMKVYMHFKGIFLHIFLMKRLSTSIAMRRNLYYQMMALVVRKILEISLWNWQYHLLEKPLVFGDIQGGFYLLGFGYLVTFIVHIILILKVKLYANANKA